MIKIITLLFAFTFILNGYGKANNEPKVANAIPTGILSVSSPDFGNDVIVSNVRPIGPMSGIKSTAFPPPGNIYVVINDTNLTSNLGLVYMQSSNSGVSWSLGTSGITPRVKYDQVKMVRTTDSNYCFFRVGGAVYRWNIINNSFKGFDSTDIADFDVAVASDNSFHLLFQNTANQIRRFGSIDRGFTWIGSGLIANGAGMPRICFSKLGDTLLLNYRGPLRVDVPDKSVVRSALYRQSSPGILALISLSFVDILTDTTVTRKEYKSVRYGTTVWTLYTEGVTGSLNIKALNSFNGGLIYTAPINVAVDPNRDEYWFDINLFSNAGGLDGGPNIGLDVVYYSDSLQGGAPTVFSDKIMYSFATLASPGTISLPVRFSDHPAIFSNSGTKPVIVELPSADMGALYLGLTGGNQNIFWDRYSAVTGVNHDGNIIPAKYELKQNYPNPFNPQTKIEFNISANSFVSLKIYDIMGREIKSLVSGNYNAGSYSVDFNAANLASGIYFYKLEAGNFSEVKKMNLIK